MNPLQGEYIASSTLIRKVLNSGNDRILSRRYLIVGGREGSVFSKTSSPMEIYYPPAPVPYFARWNHRCFILRLNSFIFMQMFDDFDFLFSLTLMNIHMNIWERMKKLLSS